MKRILAWLVLLALVLTAAPLALAAKTENTVDKRMEALAADTFARCLASSGKTTFNGHCGNFVSHQLYNLRINKWFTSSDGNDQYDYYAAMKKTSGGYYTKAYSAADYSLLGALNHITQGGTVDVYNVLVGFEKTNTEAGQKYGHVVLLYGIVDGTVYFSESYDIYLNGPHAEGGLVKCSIPEFFRSYDSWTEYEGLVVFGTGDHQDSCEYTATNLVVQARFDSILRSEPCLVGENDCVTLRRISAGERLQATGIFTTQQGQSFYRIAEGGFVAAAALGALRAGSEDLQLKKLQLPQVVQVGEDTEISGRVISSFAQIGALEAWVTDGEEELILREREECTGYGADMTRLNEALDFSYLEEGQYTLRVFAEVNCPTANNEVFYGRICLGGTGFLVGTETEAPKEMPEVHGYTEQEYVDWVYDNGWFFYDQGKPLTGWVTDCGVRYYLDETGRAVSGWVTVEDKLHYFSQTGALVTKCEIKKGKVVMVLDEAGVATVKE